MPNIQGIFHYAEFKHEQHKVLAALLYLGNVAERHVDKTIEAFHLPVNQYRILRGLKKVHPQGIGIYKLRHLLIEKNADTSRMVERLLSKGLVERRIDPHNKSIRQISITCQGKDLVERIDKHLDAFLVPVMCLSEEEALQFMTTAEKLIRSFEEVKAAAPGLSLNPNAEK